eukprot:scaffold33577_cov68-Phaeocystis_antarctica.AAC.2
MPSVLCLAARYQEHRWRTAAVDRGQAGGAAGRLHQHRRPAQEGQLRRRGLLLLTRPRRAAHCSRRGRAVPARVDAYVPEPPYCTCGLRGPASGVPYVPRTVATQVPVARGAPAGRGRDHLHDARRWQEQPQG